MHDPKGKMGKKSTQKIIFRKNNMWINFCKNNYCKNNFCDNLKKKNHKFIFPKILIIIILFYFSKLFLLKSIAPICLLYVYNFNVFHKIEG